MSLMLLEYAKTILRKVAFNTEIFERELHKFLHQLPTAEGALLQSWCLEEFGPELASAVNRVCQAVRVERTRRATFRES